MFDDAGYTERRPLIREYSRSSRFNFLRYELNFAENFQMRPRGASKRQNQFNNVKQKGKDKEAIPCIIAPVTMNCGEKARCVWCERDGDREGKTCADNAPRIAGRA
ncbi:unnamed protein product [Pieris brassicae]|uniref:Uncharacterized protein n=1 Tax=Pieris brassicae TaxID=7116 RepID=A0A9P0XAZ7_PIEBR|nr:unnamed protein product [Pieris brassicae]